LFPGSPCSFPCSLANALLNLTDITGGPARTTACARHARPALAPAHTATLPDHHGTCRPTTALPDPPRHFPTHHGTCRPTTALPDPHHGTSRPTTAGILTTPRHFPTHHGIPDPTYITTAWHRNSTTALPYHQWSTTGIPSGAPRGREGSGGFRKRPRPLALGAAARVGPGGAASAPCRPTE
jgi:hypothetical protein